MLREVTGITDRDRQSEWQKKKKRHASKNDFHNFSDNLLVNMDENLELSPQARYLKPFTEVDFSCAEKENLLSFALKASTKGLQTTLRGEIDRLTSTWTLSWLTRYDQKTSLAHNEMCSVLHTYLKNYAQKTGPAHLQNWLTVTAGKEALETAEPMVSMLKDLLFFIQKLLPSSYTNSMQNTASPKNVYQNQAEIQEQVSWPARFNRHKLKRLEIIWENSEQAL